jgi:2-amino-4-hydroxy-6-hydroxymethyldihydropteridine diphosphokinase
VSESGDMRAGGQWLRCGIAVGSNVGDRLENLRRGVRRLLERAPGMRVTAVGPLYETAPMDCAPGTGAFYNSVVEVECGLEPHALREVTAEVEGWMGRPAVRERNAPRTLDLDLLYCGERVLADEVLILPHPRLAERRFVLAPLAAVRGMLVLPGQTKTVGELLAELPEGGEVEQVREGDWLGE